MRRRKLAVRLNSDSRKLRRKEEACSLSHEDVQAKCEQWSTERLDPQACVWYGHIEAAGVAAASEPSRGANSARGPLGQR